MATAADIIRDALMLLGVLAAGEPLKSEDQADGIRALNRMLGSWANERLLVHGSRRSTHTLTPSLSPHTIGPSGTFVATRPTRIEAAGLISPGQSFEQPINVLTDAEYRNLSDKTLTSTAPTDLWIEQTAPNARLWLWPIPTAAATLVLYSWSRISEFAAADVVQLPDGYEDALVHALALRLAPSFGVQPDAQLKENASTTLAAIERTNQPEELLELDASVPGMRRSSFNIYTGE